MRSAVLLTSVLSMSLVGCRAKKLEEELGRVRDQLAQAEQGLGEQQADNKRLRSKNQSYEQRVEELLGEITQLNTQIDDLATKHGMTAKELAELRSEKAKRERELRVYRDLFAQLEQMVAAGTIEVVFRKGRMTVKLSNAILFDSGKSKLRSEGTAAVAQIVPALMTVGEREFLVAGHTDDIPIKTARYKSNWELSTARAVSMVDAMIEAGYPPQRIGAAGFGEFDPTGPNDSEKGREQNRRIEIILMPNLGEIPGMKEMLERGNKNET
jgi:chemotaxis protein MotB